MSSLGKMLVVFGLILIVAGFLIQLFWRLPAFGRLPGDVYIKKGSFTFYFPIVTSLLISAILSFVLTLFGRR